MLSGIAFFLYDLVLGKFFPYEYKNGIRMYEKEWQHQRQKIKNEKKQTQTITCPKCDSTQIGATKQGYGIGKGLVGAALVGPVGLAAGAVGSKNIKKICLQCKYEWD